jgi:energy-coupling factor transport system permease protein
VIGRAPIPLLVFGTAACTLAFAADQPLILAAVAAGAVALHFAARRRRRMYLVAGLVVGLGVMLLNPLVQANGDLILFELPDIPIIDLQVTLEEVVAGAAMGLRAFAVTVLLGALLAHIDPDRLLAAASRLMPRSALAASIAARMLPTLERDAVSLSETARLRGVSLSSGRWSSRARTAGALATPLVGSALERSLDVAEAMAVRGYGSGPRTRMAEPAMSAPEWTVLALAVPLGTLAGLAVAGPVGSFAFYPTLDPVLTREAVVAAAVALMTMAGAALRLAR